MGFWNRLLGKKKEDQGAVKPAQGTFYILTVNARLEPIHRGEAYEDPLDERLEKAGLGSVTGGGTMLVLDENREIKYCDIEICLDDGGEEAERKLISVIDELGLPKGSTLTKGDAVIRELGSLDGLALYLNGTDLADEVYERCDINHVMAELGDLLGSTGRLLSWREGPSDTALYFYGDSFGEMRARMDPFLAEYPLCQKCRIEQIAG